jgi:hypothetical protein
VNFPLRRSAHRTEATVQVPDVGSDPGIPNASRTFSSHLLPSCADVMSRCTVTCAKLRTPPPQIASTKITRCCGWGKLSDMIGWVSAYWIWIRICPVYPSVVCKSPANGCSRLVLIASVAGFVKRRERFPIWRNLESVRTILFKKKVCTVLKTLPQPWRKHSYETKN